MASTNTSSRELVLGSCGLHIALNISRAGLDATSWLSSLVASRSGVAADTSATEGFLVAFLTGALCLAARGWVGGGIAVVEVASD